MAFVQDQTDPNAPQQQGQPGGAPGSMSQPVSTSSTGGAGSSTPAGSPQGAGSVQTSTQAPPVQDLHAYLAANADQAVGMGQNIAGNLNATAGKVTGDINAAQTDVNNQVSAQNITPNAGLVDQAAQDPAAFVQNQQTLFQ